MTKFKVGMKVTDGFKKGTVTRIVDDSYFPVNVDFGEYTELYKKDGRLWTTSKPTLSPVEDFEFQIGDTVDWDGMKGEIIEVCADRVLVKFKYRIIWFYSEGCGQAISQITLFSRPKKKVKKTIEVWVNVYEHGIDSHQYIAEQEADRYAGFEPRIACVKLTGEYEVDSD